MPPPDYGRSLRGFSVNLLVAEVLRYGQVEWMLHAHHTYDAHPLYDEISTAGAKGLGVELRLHDRDPDEAQRIARDMGYEIVQPARDKPHGLRESFLRDHDGFVWVTDIPLAVP